LNRPQGISMTTDFQPIFLSIYLRQLSAWGFTPAAPFMKGRYRRFSGDLVALGKVEVLIRQP
jgi:hypothetical protein